MKIKVKNRDPKTTDFKKNELVININEGSLFYKSNLGLHKVVTTATQTTVATETVEEETAPLDVETVQDTRLIRELYLNSILRYSTLLHRITQPFYGSLPSNLLSHILILILCIPNQREILCRFVVRLVCWPLFLPHL